MRFYDHDGIEMDVQDPKFFIDEDLLIDTKDAIDEILTYSEFENLDYGITI